MTFRIFNLSTNNLINRSIVRPTNDIIVPKLYTDPINLSKIVASLHEPNDSSLEPEQG